MLVNIDLIKIYDNFRKDFKDIKKLSENIKKHGLIQPVILDKNMVLVAGERRLRACKMIGMKEIPAEVKEYTDDHMRRVHNAYENLERKSLTQSEEAEAIAWLKKNLKNDDKISKKGGDTTELAKESRTPKKSFGEIMSEKTGQSKKTVEKKARLGELMTKKTAKALDNGDITQKQALKIVAAEDQNAALKEAKQERNPDAVIVNAEEDEIIKKARKYYRDLLICSEKLKLTLKGIRNFNIRYADAVSGSKIRMNLAELNEEIRTFSRYIGGEDAERKIKKVKKPES